MPVTWHDLATHLAREGGCMNHHAITRYLELNYSIPRNISRVRVNKDGEASFTNNHGVRRWAKLSNTNFIKMADEVLAKGELPEEHVPIHMVSGKFTFSHRIIPSTEKEKAKDREYQRSRKKHKRVKHTQRNPLARIEKAIGKERVRELVERVRKQEEEVIA